MREAVRTRHNVSVGERGGERRLGGRKIENIGIVGAGVMGLTVAEKIIAAGHKIKLLNQLMFGVINAMTAEMMAIAEKIGIEPRRLYEIITASKAGTVNNLFKELGKRVADGNYDEATVTVDLPVKDIKLAVQMAKENNALPLLARTIEFINEVSQVQGLGNKDTSIMWTSYRGIWAGK